MALRFLLVSLVAGMGFEMPNGTDVETWTRPGRDWVEARVADIAGLRTRAERAFAGADDREPVAEAVSSLAGAEAPLAASDLAFEVVSEGMAADFAVDLALTRSEEPPAPAVADAAMLADLDGPAALPSGESVAALLAAEDAPAPSRSSRLFNAVRLTREAVHAWAILVQPAEAVATR